MGALRVHCGCIAGTRHEPRPPLHRRLQGSIAPVPAHVERNSEVEIAAVLLDGAANAGDVREPGGGGTFVQEAHGLAFEVDGGDVAEGEERRQREREVSGPCCGEDI